MNIKKTMKSLLAGALALGGLIASAAPTVEITKVQSTTSNCVVYCSYTVSGLEDEAYDLVLKVEAKDTEKGAVSTNLVFEFVAEGAAIQPIDCKAVLGKAYPNVAFYATLEKSEEAVQLWDGGPYWARWNLGAKKPEEAGFYFWWGDTEGYVRNAADDGWVSAKDGTTTFQFLESDATASQTYDKSKATLLSEGWIDESGNLTMAHDAARVNLGGDWRMPTEAEIRALVANCTWTWTTRNGVNGYLVTGKDGYSKNSIFLPTTGYGTDSSVYYAEHGNYWASTPTSGSSFDAGILDESKNKYFFNSGYRFRGRTVRPVRSAE